MDFVKERKCLAPWIKVVNKFGERSSIKTT